MMQVTLNPKSGHGEGGQNVSGMGETLPVAAKLSLRDCSSAPAGLTYYCFNVSSQLGKMHKIPHTEL